MSRIYTTKTPSLKATIADIRNLDVKKMSINGEDLSTIIKNNKTIILDERGTLANDELDIWNSSIKVDELNNVVVDTNVMPYMHSYQELNDEQVNAIISASKVIDNQVFDKDNNHLMFWQTSGLTESNSLFQGKTNISVFKSDLSSLTQGAYMFSYSPIVTVEADMSSLTVGTGMFNGCSSLDKFTGNLSSLETYAEAMFFNCTQLRSFESDLSSLIDAENMFYNCSHLTSFDVDLPSLVRGDGMFGDCRELATFNSNLDSLESGYYMFSNCQNLHHFNSDLSSLSQAGEMFSYCSNLTRFDSNLESLWEGEYMFQYCEKLTEFNSNMSSLNLGYSMFENCSKLTSFNATLSSLSSGVAMFSSCRLDSQSVANIITFLPIHESQGIITIGIDIADDEDAKQAFAEECYCDSWEELNQDFTDKNWDVQWQFNGEASTFDLRSPKPSTAVFARLEEVIMPTDEKAHKPHYQYTSQDGSKFYNIHWYHDSNTNNEGYDYFESLEEAIAAYGVIAK